MTFFSSSEKKGKCLFISLNKKQNTFSQISVKDFFFLNYTYSSVPIKKFKMKNFHENVLYKFIQKQNLFPKVCDFT